MTNLNHEKVCLTPLEIEKILNEKGIQATAQRIAICRFVMCEANHPTADQVKEWADNNFPKLSLATVYNTLNTLVEAGLLIEVKLPHSGKVIYDNNITKHFHFVDSDTGEVFDISLEDVNISPNLKRRFKIHDMNLVITGKVVGR